MSFENFTLASVMRENGRARGERVAIVDGDQRITYKQLADRMGRLATGLHAAGVGTGERVLWIGRNSGAIIELLTACSRLGAMLCAANWRQSAEELAWTIEDFDPRLIVWDASVREQLAAARSHLHDLKARTYFNFAPPDGLGRFLHGTSYEGEEPCASTPFYALYTAAFDGRPQAAMLSNTAILFQNLILGRDQAIDEDSVFLNSGPMFHIGTMMTTFSVLHHGGTNVVAQGAEPERLLDLIQTERCTHAFLMGPTLTQMEQVMERAPRDVSSLWPSGRVERPKSILTMPALAPMAQRGGGVYGQSEACGIICSAARGGGAAGKAPLAEVRLVDEHDRDVPDGEVGEIAIRSPLVMNSYFRRDAENTWRRRNGWHHTRDLGRRRPDGAIEFVGPKAVLIKSAAENIYPAEVEACLREHPAVANVCVIGIPDPQWGQNVRAVVQLKTGAHALEDELIAHCKQRIASYKKPRSVIFVETLPLTGAGFVDRGAVDAAHGGGDYPSAR